MKRNSNNSINEKFKLKLPVDFQQALADKPLLEAKWRDITPIARRDFVSWINSAKSSETRMRRIKIACSKLETGKRRPCCYAVVPMDFYKALGFDLKAKNGWKNLNSMERRDFVDWINEEKKSDKRNFRIKKACALISDGKRP